VSALSFERITTVPALCTSKRFLFAHFEGGGNTPPVCSIVRRLVARGHEVRVLGDLCNRVEHQHSEFFKNVLRLPSLSAKFRILSPSRTRRCSVPRHMQRGRLVRKFGPRSNRRCTKGDNASQGLRRARPLF
jgi:hypothetical protein